MDSTPQKRTQSVIVPVYKKGDLDISDPCQFLQNSETPGNSMRTPIILNYDTGQ